MTTITRLKAEDIMQKDVLTFDASTPIAEAIKTLEEMEITGAPVVDGEGKLVGVLTTRDVARTEHVRAGRIAPERGEFAMVEPADEENEGGEAEDVIYDKEDFSPAVLGEDTVADWMNRNVVVVDPDASLRDVCRKMLAEHIHRVIVVKLGRLVGVITSFDVVRMIAEGRSE